MADLFAPNVLVAFAVCIGAALATMLGGLLVVTSHIPRPRLLALGLAFAGGAMVYISLVEIFWKSHLAFTHALGGDRPGYLAATMAFFAGIAVVLLLDTLVPNPHNELTKLGENAQRDHIRRVGTMAALAITAHNFPEGMASFFAALDNPTVGASLAFAIAVHNIPEGVSIAIPVLFATGSKRYALLACAVSALAEPVGALIGYLLLAQFLTQFVFGCVFGVIAGIMVFLSLDELLPSAKRYAKGHDAVIGMVTGMGAIAISLVLFR